MILKSLITEGEYLTEIGSYTGTARNTERFKDKHQYDQELAFLTKMSVPFDAALEIVWRRSEARMGSNVDPNVPIKQEVKDYFSGAK